MVDTTLAAGAVAPDRTGAMMRPMDRLKWHYSLANNCVQFYSTVPAMLLSFRPAMRSSWWPLLSASSFPNRIFALSAPASEHSEIDSAFWWSIRVVSRLTNGSFVHSSGHCFRGDWMHSMVPKLMPAVNRTCIDSVTTIVCAVDASDGQPSVNFAHWFSPAPANEAFR